MNLKGKDVLIGVLFGLNIFLVAFTILMLTGVVKFDNENVVVNNGNGNGEIDKSKSDVNSNSIDSTVLDNLYNIIGILPKDKEYVNNCLNEAISVNDYRANSKGIFSWYAELHNMTTYHKDAVLTVLENGAKVSVYMAPATRSISKKDASKIIALFNLDEMDGFFDQMPSPYDDEYYYGSQTTQPLVCNFDVEHNTTYSIVDSSTIRITDNQVVKEYDWSSKHTSENMVSKKNQIVMYEFKKGTSGEYYLNDVVVK